jgi:hypothetical protein
MVAKLPEHRKSKVAITASLLHYLQREWSA